MDKTGKIAIGLIITAIVVGVLITASVMAPPPNKQCRDGNDNDGDGLVDWPADPGCSSKNDRDENNCGNAVVDGTEVCDGSNLGGESCSSLGFTGGVLSCASSCGAFDTSACYNYTNTCFDTDGGFDLTTAGTVYGNTSGVPFAVSDTCLDSVTLSERYCSGTIPLGYNISCVGNGTACVAGACI